MLKILPKIRDRISFLYFEHCRIEQKSKAIVIFQGKDRFVIPCANISTLLLGPGTSITHAAIKTLSESSCIVNWVGESGLRFYASGYSIAETSDRSLWQINQYVDTSKRLESVRKMYEKRFEQKIPKYSSLQQIRGKEGVRVRTLYNKLSKETGIRWQGRHYKKFEWEESDAINSALSIANNCLYAVCLSAITSVGYIPSIGFVHTGHRLSFVYDIADLYKEKTTIPVSFYTVADSPNEWENIIRKKCKEKFSEYKIMNKIVEDIDKILDFQSKKVMHETNLLWDDQIDWVEGGKNWGDIE